MRPWVVQCGWINGSGALAHRANTKFMCTSREVVTELLYCEKVSSNSGEILNLRWEHLRTMEENSAHSTNKSLITPYDSLKRVGNLKQREELIQLLQRENQDLKSENELLKARILELQESRPSSFNARYVRSSMVGQMLLDSISIIQETRVIPH